MPLPQLPFTNTFDECTLLEEWSRLFSNATASMLKGQHTTCMELPTPVLDGLTSTKKLMRAS